MDSLFIVLWVFLRPPLKVGSATGVQCVQEQNAIHELINFLNLGVITVQCNLRLLTFTLAPPYPLPAAQSRIRMSLFGCASEKAWARAVLLIWWKPIWLAVWNIYRQNISDWIRINDDSREWSVDHPGSTHITKVIPSFSPDNGYHFNPDNPSAQLTVIIYNPGNSFKPDNGYHFNPDNLSAQITVIIYNTGNSFRPDNGYHFHPDNPSAQITVIIQPR